MTHSLEPSTACRVSSNLGGIQSRATADSSNGRHAWVVQMWHGLHGMGTMAWGPCGWPRQQVRHETLWALARRQQLRRTFLGSACAIRMASAARLGAEVSLQSTYSVMGREDGCKAACATGAERDLRPTWQAWQWRGPAAGYRGRQHCRPW